MKRVSNVEYNDILTVTQDMLDEGIMNIEIIYNYSLRKWTIIGE